MYYSEGELHIPNPWHEASEEVRVPQKQRKVPGVWERQQQSTP